MEAMSSLELAIIVMSIAFFCEFMDSTLGMGYGTTMTPVLILLGYHPMHIIPVVLLSELITGVTAGFFHHREGNVNFKPKTKDFSSILHHLKALGYVESFKRELPPHLQVALLLTICSVIGTVVAVFVAVNIPRLWLKLYIGCLVLSMGFVMIICLRREFTFSWKKIISLGLIASFNKGMSGGGYGPVVTGGQVLSGVDGKSAVGITSLAEGLTCLVGFIAYLIVSEAAIDWSLAPIIIAGAVCSIPLSTKSVKKLSSTKLKLFIAIVTIVLGLSTLAKTVGR